MPETTQYKVVVGYNTDNGFVAEGAVIELNESAAKPLIDSGNIVAYVEGGDAEAAAEATPAAPEAPSENPGEGSAAPLGDAPVADLGNPEVAQAPADAPVDGAPIADAPVGDPSVQNDAATDPVV